MAENTIWFPVVPDSSGNVFPDRIDGQLSMTNAKQQEIYVIPDPGGGGDHGVEGSVDVPADYASGPKVVVKGILDGAPTGGSADILAFSIKQLGVDDNESVDQAYETEDTNTLDLAGSHSDEDLVEVEISITPASAYVAGDEVFLEIDIDDSASNPYTGNFLLLEAGFRYTTT